VTDFVSRYAKTWVRVRSPHLATLGPALGAQGATVQYSGPDSADVFAADAAAIGELAASLGVALHELSPQSSSLEEAFLEGTRSVQEFGAQAVPPAGQP
jgi:ABC-2 type transport system ATP-binding protein